MTTAYPAGDPREGRPEAEGTTGYPASPGYGPAAEGTPPSGYASTGYTAPVNQGAPMASGYAPVVRDLPKGLAITALVLGILSLPGIFTVFGGIILGLLAIIFGAVALSKARRGVAGGRGMAIGGIITGLIGLLVTVAIVAFGLSLINSPAGKQYQNCVQNSSNPQNCSLSNS